MKYKNILTFSLLLIFGLVSCNKVSEDETDVIACIPDEEPLTYNDDVTIWPPGEMRNGRARAIKLNKKWEASARCEIRSDSNSINLVFTTDNTNYEGITRSLVDIVGIPLDTGCYKLSQIQYGASEQDYPIAHYWTQAWDVAEDYYDLANEDDVLNKIELIEISLDSVIGKFAFSLVKNKRRSVDGSSNPDYLRFLNGEFQVAIK